MKKPRRERKVNTIKALKQELEYYKKQPVRIRVVDRTELRHMKLQTAFSPREIIMVPKSIISDITIDRMTKAFSDYISSLAIETTYDAKSDIYKASLDLWVKEGH